MAFFGRQGLRAVAMAKDSHVAGLQAVGSGSLAVCVHALGLHFFTFLAESRLQYVDTSGRPSEKGGFPGQNGGPPPLPRTSSGIPRAQHVLTTQAKDAPRFLTSLLSWGWDVGKMKLDEICFATAAPSPQEAPQQHAKISNVTVRRHFLWRSQTVDPRSPMQLMRIATAETPTMPGFVACISLGAQDTKT